MARRVNTKFLTILTVSIVALGLAALIVNRFFVHESPERYVAAGQQYMADKKYEDAAKAFGKAVSLNPRDAELWVGFGDALNQLSPQDVGYLQAAQQKWEQALAINPMHKGALDRLMQFWSEVANLDSSRPQYFESLNKTATNLFAATTGATDDREKETHAKAEVAMTTSKIRPWLAGVEKDPQEIKKTIATLEELMKKYPSDADLPMFTAQAKLKQAEIERQNEHPDDAARLIGEAVKIVQDAVSRAPSAAMYFSAAQVAQAQEFLVAAERPVAPADDKQTDAWKKKRDDWKKKYDEVHAKRLAYQAKAQELVMKDGVDNPLYVQINLSGARAVADKAEALKILRDLMEKKPDDQQVRLALAEQLAGDASKRDEAIEILDRPFASSTLTGPRSLLVRELQIRTLATATNLRLDEYASASRGDREKLLGRIQDSLAKIESREGAESARGLRLRGKLYRLQGENVKAIQTLERARQIAEKNGNLELTGDRIDRWEVTDLLAKAYLDTNQTGRAQTLLTELVNRFPTYDPARLLLAQLLVKDGKYDDAQPHIKLLQERKPDDPEVLKLMIQVSNGPAVGTASKEQQANQAKREQVKAIYAKLPEATKANLLDKITAAMVIDQPDEATRLLDKAQAANPGDIDIARMGVRVYRQLDDLDKARAFVEVAYNAKPSDDQLQLLRKQVQDLTPEALIRIGFEEAEKTPEPMRSIKRAGLFRRQNKPQESLAELLNAQKIKPNDTDITMLLFSHYLWQQKFDKAEALVDRLASANQDQCGGLLLRYQLAMARGDIQAAIRIGNDLTQRMGEFGQAWLALARAYQAAGNYEEALNKYVSALEKQNDSPDVLRGMIECYYALNRPTDAKSYIARARQAMPGNPVFQEMEIQHEMNYGDPQKAIGPREELAKKDANSPNAVVTLGQAYLAGARALAAKPDQQVAANQMFGKAKSTFKQGITKWPDEIIFYAYYAETCARSGSDQADAEAQIKALAARDAWKGKNEPQQLLAEFYAVGGRGADAEASYRTLIAADPKNVDLQIKLSNLLMSEQKKDEALKVLEANADHPSIARRRVQILLAAGQDDDASTVLAKALETSPKNLELLHMAIKLDLDHSKFDSADKWLNRALEIDPKNPTTHYYVGLLKSSGPRPDFDEAVKQFTIAKDSPTLGVEARFALAECYKRKGNPDAGIRELESALSQQPTNWRVRLGLLDAYTAFEPPRWVDSERVIRDAKNMPGYTPNPDLLQREASMWSARSEPKKAVAIMKEALAARPDDKGLQRNYLTLLLTSRNAAEVNQEVDKLVAKDPTLWWAYAARAVAKRDQGRKDEAIRDFDAAINAANTAHDDAAVAEIYRTMADVLGPQETLLRIESRAANDDHWKLMKAQLQATSGDTPAAIKTLEQVLAHEDQLKPIDRQTALRYGGMFYLVVNQPSKSAACYERLLKLTPDDMIALNNMACLLAENVQPPRPQDGLQYSQHAYDLIRKAGRRDAMVFDTHGWMLVLANRVDEGIDVLRSAIETKSLPDSHYHLAEAYLRKAYADQAQRELETAMDLVKRAEQDRTGDKDALAQLKLKIEGAAGRAGVMIRQKKSTANVNGSTVTNEP